MDKLILRPQDIDFVIYHRDCTDGFCAAWYPSRSPSYQLRPIPRRIAHRFLHGKGEYQAAKHGDQPPNVKGRNVAIFDFTWEPEVLSTMIAEASKLVVIDHHKSAQEMLKGLIPEQHLWFDMQQSAAAMAWAYFFPTTPPPRFLSYVEDRDLWRFRSEESRAYSTYLDVLPLSFEEYERQVSDSVVTKAVEAGKLMLLYQQSLISEAATQAVERRLQGYRVCVANATMWMSEVGNELATRDSCDFALVWNYNQRDRCYLCSLRSCRDAPDLSAIARKFGGGGHQRASGFKWDKPLAELWDKP